MDLLHILRVADESQPKMWHKSNTTKILDKLHILQIVQNFSNQCKSTTVSYEAARARELESYGAREVESYRATELRSYGATELRS